MPPKNHGGILFLNFRKLLDIGPFFGHFDKRGSVVSTCFFVRKHTSHLIVKIDRKIGT